MDSNIDKLLTIEFFVVNEQPELYPEWEEHKINHNIDVYSEVVDDMDVMLSEIFLENNKLQLIEELSEDKKKKKYKIGNTFPIELTKYSPESNGATDVSELIKLRYKNWTHKNRIKQYLDNNGFTYEFANGENLLIIEENPSFADQIVKEIHKLGVHIDLSESFDNDKFLDLWKKTDKEKIYYILTKEIGKEGENWTKGQVNPEDFKDELKEKIYHELLDLNESSKNIPQEILDRAKKISDEEGVAQHINLSKDGKYSISDWYDSDSTVKSFGVDLYENNGENNVVRVAKEIYGSLEKAQKAYNEDKQTFYDEMKAQIEPDEVELIDEMFNRAKNLSESHTLVEPLFWEKYNVFKEKLKSSDSTIIKSLSYDLENVFAKLWLTYIGESTYDKDSLETEFPVHIKDFIEKNIDEFLYDSEDYKEVLKSAYGSKSNYKDTLINLSLLSIPQILNDNILTNTYPELMLKNLFGSVMLECTSESLRKYDSKIYRSNKTLVNHIVMKNGFRLNENKIHNVITGELVGVFSKDFRNICLSENYNLAKKYNLAESSKARVSVKKFAKLYENKISDDKIDNFDKEFLENVEIKLTVEPSDITKQFLTWLSEVTLSQKEVLEFYEENRERILHGVLNTNDTRVLNSILKENGECLDAMFKGFLVRESIEIISGINFIIEEKHTENGVITELEPLTPTDSDKLELTDKESLVECLDEYGELVSIDDKIEMVKQEKSAITKDEIIKEFAVSEEDAKDILDVLNDKYTENVQEFVIDISESKKKFE